MDTKKIIILPMLWLVVCQSGYTEAAIKGAPGCKKPDIDNLKKWFTNEFKGKIDDMRDEVAGLRSELADIRDEVYTVRDTMAGIRRDLLETRRDDAMNATGNDIETTIRGTGRSLCNVSGVLTSEQLTYLKREISSDLTTELKQLVSSSSPDQGTGGSLCNVSGVLTSEQLTYLKREISSDLTTELKALVSSGSPGQGCNSTLPTRPDCTKQPNGLNIIRTEHGHHFLAMCEDGWMIVAHRYDGTVNFNVGWDSYKLGFGDRLGEHFVGMDNLVALFRHKRYEARFELTPWKGDMRYAYYYKFEIHDESDAYRLSLSGYNGTAGDSLTRFYNHAEFTTRDKANSKTPVSCAQTYGPFWYNGCNPHGSVFGRYQKSPGTCSAPYQCISWYYWPEKMHTSGNNMYSFKEMKIKIHAIKP